jgi:hypothetical protein
VPGYTCGVPGLVTAAVVAAILMLAQCGGGSVALPPQRRSYSGPEPGAFGEFARVADPHCDGNFVRGFRPSGRWAWTARRAEMQFMVESGARKFNADIYLAGKTLKETGPVTISFYVNGRLLGAMRCDGAREFVFEKAVPKGWIDPARPVAVTLETDKAWVSPDGTEYGFLLVSAGFLPR